MLSILSSSLDEMSRAVVHLWSEDLRDTQNSLKSPFENGRHWGGKSGQALLSIQTKGKYISGALLKQSVF